MTKYELKTTDGGQEVPESLRHATDLDVHDKLMKAGEGRNTKQSGFSIEKAPDGRVILRRTLVLSTPSAIVAIPKNPDPAPRDKTGGDV